MSIAGELHAALVGAGLDIDGVAMADTDPKSDWRVIWTVKPAPEAEAIAASVIAAFDPVAAAARVSARKFLRDSDAKLVRAIEDVIELLKSNGTAKGGDLPQALDELIAARKAARATVSAVRG